MAGGFIQVPPDSSGKKVETNSPDGVTQRQVVTPGSSDNTNTQEFNAVGQAQVVEQGAPNLATNQVNVLNTDSIVVAARTTRRAVIITLLGNTPVDIYIGPPGVSTASGIPLYGIKGATIAIPTNGAVHAISSGATQAVAYMEVYD